MMRNLFISLLSVAGFALADSSVCTELCGNCKGAPSEDEACSKVFATCTCGEPAGEPALGSVPEAASSLGNSLYSAALSGKLAAKVSVVGGTVENVAFEKVPGVSPAEEPKPSELSGKCAELCRTVGELGPEDQMVEIVEKSCGCGARVADSLKVEEFKASRLENAKLAADSVLKACTGRGTCLISVTLSPEDFGVATLELLGTTQAERRRKALGNSLYEAALAGKFAAKLLFMGDTLTEFEVSEAPGAIEVLEPQLRPFSDECVQFCTASAELDPSDPMVELTEKSCGCSARLADSLKIEVFKKARVENAGFAADSVVNFCASSNICRLELQLEPETFALTSMKLDESKELMQLKAARIEALKEALHASCFDGVCKVKLKLPETGQIELAPNAKGKTKVAEPEAPPLSEKCVEFCAALPADSTSQMFKQIEGTCGCKVHERDSVALSSFRARRDSNALAAATSIAELCYEEKTCEVEASLNKTTFALASLNLAGEPEKLLAEATDEDEAADENSRKKSTVIGVLAYGGGFSANYDYGDYGLKWSADGGFEFALGGFWRWYFYEYGSVQAGLNVVYSYIDLGSDSYGEAAAESSEGETETEGEMETDSDSDSDSESGSEVDSDTESAAAYLFKYGLKNHKISLEIPLQVRAGWKLVSEVSLYATFVFTMRKPLWEYLKYSGSEAAVSGSSGEYRAFDDWEFLGHVGAGVEVGRRVSVEALFGLFDLGTVDDYVEQDFSWRIKADFAW